MAVTYDPAKRARTLVERGLDFDDAELVFAGITFEVEDRRKQYGEKRVICFDILPRANGCHWLYAAWRGSPHFQYEKSK